MTIATMTKHVEEATEHRRHWHIDEGCVGLSLNLGTSGTTISMLVVRAYLLVISWVPCSRSQPTLEIPVALHQRKDLVIHRSCHHLRLDHSCKYLGVDARRPETFVAAERAIWRSTDEANDELDKDFPQLGARQCSAPEEVDVFSQE
jgi:hypothetical protein